MAASRIDMLARTLVNGLEVVRFGGLRTTEQPAPYDVVVRQPTYRLRRYFPDGELGVRPQVLLVPPLMLAADVWDVSERSSAVTLLRRQDIDPWVIDFGDPAREPDGMRRNVTDHVLAVDDAFERIREMTRRDVHLAGYSQGGLFCYQVAALRKSDGILSIVGLGSPLLPANLPLPEEAARWFFNATSAVLGNTGVPGWLLKRMFKFANPPRAIKTELAFLRALHDREALLPRERQRQFLTGQGWVNWSGPAIAEIAEIMSDNRYSRGGLVFEDRAASLSDITCPVLIFVGESDEYGPPESVRAIAHAAPNADVYENVAPVGHFGLGVGSHANRVTWPTVAEWIRWREEGGAAPQHISLLDPAELTYIDDQSSSLQDRMTYGAALAAQTGVVAVRAVAEVARQAAGSALDMGLRCSAAVAQSRSIGTNSTQHSHLVRFGAGGEGARRLGQHLLHLRQQGLHARRREAARRQRRAWVGVSRRASRRARRRTDGHQTQCIDGRRRSQPDRCGVRSAAAGRVCSPPSGVVGHFAGRVRPRALRRSGRGGPPGAGARRPPRDGP